MLLDFVLSLQKKGIKLWALEDKINVFLPDQVVLSQEETRCIQENKSALLHVLQMNNILTNKDFDKAILKFPEEAQMPLSFAQERLWFIEQYTGGSNAYNIPMSLKLEADVDINCIKQSLEAIVRRHEILRTIFAQDDLGNAYQVVLNDSVPIEEYTLSDSAFQVQLDLDVKHVFDLKTRHPLKLVIYHVGDKQYLLINVHHIAFDGWSIPIFLKSFYIEL